MLDSSLSSAQGQDFEKGSATHCPKKSFFPYLTANEIG